MLVLQGGQCGVGARESGQREVGVRTTELYQCRVHYESHGVPADAEERFDQADPGEHHTVLRELHDL